MVGGQPSQMEVQFSALGLVVETNAFEGGCGAYCNGVLTGGCWDEMDDKAAHQCIEDAGSILWDQVLCQEHLQLPFLLLSDNITVVAYVNHKEGTNSRILTLIMRALAVVPRLWGNNHSPTPAWTGECLSELHVQAPVGQDRLEAQPSTLLAYWTNDGDLSI